MFVDSTHRPTLFGVILCTLAMALSTFAAATENLKKDELDALATITQGTSKFAVSLYRALISKNSGNVFVSPLSVQIVLALAYTGAKGDTANELAKVLSLPEKKELTLVGYQSLLRILQDPVLKIANRMFVEKSAPVKEDFQANANKYFLSPAESVDFLKECDRAREAINTWVEDQTNKKITNLLPPGTISSDTRLVLVNAIHFKADWRQKFLEKDTKKQPFHVSKTNSIPILMMNTKKKFGFVQDRDLEAKILELDYAGNNFRMLVILPNEIDGLEKLEAKLETVNLVEKVRYMPETTVTVTLPKFKLEETMNLNDILISLGAKAMFNSHSADFSGLSNEDLYVSHVVQKAFVEVNEEGTEAAAATGLVMEYCAFIEPPPSPSTFIADHPFLFTLMCNKDTCLFIGRINQPTSH